MAASSHFWMSKKHFVSHLLPFQINTTIFISVNFFLQNGCRRPFWMSENHFRSHFWPFQINTHIFFKHFLQNGFRRPSWSSHFGCPKFTLDLIFGYFRSIQIFYFFTKWLPVAILDVRKSLSISFLAISDRYASYFFWKFWTKWLPSAILDIRNSLSHFWPF